MFWGRALKPNEAFQLKHAFKDRDFPVLHLSSCVLSKNSVKDGNKTYVYLSNGTDLQNLQVSVLSDKNEVQSLNLYVNVVQDITISTKGPGEVHLCGYFEPN